MVSITLEAVITVVMPWLKIGLWLILALALAGGIGYYVFVVLRRRKWHINIWEEKSNGKIYLVERDKLIARKFNKGKQTMYLLKKNRVETIPPPDECVDRIGKKEIANYLRVLEDYIPLKRDVEIEKGMVNKVKEAIRALKRMTSAEAESVYMYIPLSRALVGQLNFNPIPYDVNMMRINALDNREKLYADTKNFWEKYGNLIAIGAIVILIIVVLYFSYDYSKSVIQMAMGAADKVGKPLATLVEKLGVS